MPQEATKLTSGSLTLYLQNDGLRLNHSVADTQSAAILPSIHSLHVVNAVKNTRTHVTLNSASRKGSPVPALHTWQ